MRTISIEIGGAVLAAVCLAGAGRLAHGEATNVFGGHFWDYGENTDIMNHRTGWTVEAGLGSDNANVGRYEDMVGESFTVVQRLDWRWDMTVPTDPAEQDTFASQCRNNWVKKIKQYCRHYVIGNEMEFFVLTSDYAAAFQKVRTQIKAEQPEARVMIGHFNDQNHCRDCVQILGRDGYDGIATHTANDVPTGLLNMLDDPTLHPEGAARPGVGVYVTEWGWVVDTVPEDECYSRIRGFYQALGESNTSRARQVYCACWFVYWPAGAWHTFSLQLADYENAAFEAANALGTGINAYANTPVIMSNAYATIYDGGNSVNVQWNTSVPARRQFWSMEDGGTIGQSTALTTALSTSHQQAFGTSPHTVYQVMPISTREDYGDLGGRRFRVKSGPWPRQITQTGPGRVVVHWTTDWPADSKVEYGPTPALGQSVYRPGSVTDHNVRLIGLGVGQQYYRVLSSEENPDSGQGRLYMQSTTLTLDVGAMVPGDFDDDDDVDMEDFGHFQVCLSGSGVYFATGCDLADLDSDEDVDQVDRALFQECLTGAGMPGDIHCAD